MTDRRLQSLSPEDLSAFMDDELLPSGQSPSPDERATWHEYHLIGDVLRSADTARGDGLRFAAAVMQKLEAEPVILVPVARPRVMSPVRRWAPGLAAAAAVLMTTVVVLLGDSGSAPSPNLVAGAAAPAPTAAAAAYVYAHQVHAPMPVRPASFQPMSAERDR